MKKGTGVVGVVVVLGAAYLGATWYVGKQAQTTVEHAVAQANERFAKVLGTELGGSELKLGISDYQRGFFSSDVTYALSLKDEDDKPVELILRDHMQHGPFPLDALRAGDFKPMLAYSQSQLVASPAIQKWFDSQKGASPLQIATHIGFGGTGKSVWTFAPVEAVEDNNKISFSGGTIDVKFNNDFNDSTATARFDAFSLDDQQTGKGLKVKNIQANSVTTIAAQNDVKTQSSATIDSFVIGNANDDPVTIDKLSVSVDSQQKDKLVNGSVRYDFGRMAVGDMDLGSLAVGGKIQQVDVAALTALAAEYDAIETKHGKAGDEDFVLTDAEEAVLREKLMAVLALNPVVAIDPLVWKNAKGESHAALQVNFASPSDAKEQRVDVLLAQILKRIKLDLVLSKPMLIQAFGQAQDDPQQKQQMEMMGAMIYDQYVASLREIGLVTVDGDTAAAAILYENDKVILNGETMTVAEFMQRAMSVMMM